MKNVLLALLVISGFCANGIAATLFQADGHIVSGDSQLVMRPSGLLNLFDGEGRQYDFFLSIGYPAKPGRLEPGKLKGAKVSVDEKAQTTTFSAIAEPPGTAPVPFEYSMALIGERKVRVTLKVGADGEGGKGFQVGNRLHVTRDVVSGGNISIGGQLIPIASSPPQKYGTRLGGAKEMPVILNDGIPERRLAILPVSDVTIVAVDNNTVTHRPPFLEVIFEMGKGTLQYDLELPEVVEKPRSEHAYAGIDFWALDRLPMPQYDASRNLVQNPGFEAGFDYWRTNSYGSMSGEPRFDEYYAISHDNPRSGRSCTALRGEPGQSPAEIASFAIPVEKGKEYTLSFYARGEKPGMSMKVDAFGFFDEAGRVLGRSQKVTETWQRYSFTFKAPNQVLSVGFGNHDPAGDSMIFVDDVQLEQAAAVSDFTTKAVLASVRSDARGNFWEPGTNPNAVLELCGLPGANGEVHLTQTDLFDVQTDRGNLVFTLDANGGVKLPLPWASDLPLGLYIITAEVKSGEYSGKDYGRLAVMRFLSNTHKHKDIFSSPFNWRYPDWKREMEFYKRVGIGSSMLHDPGPHRYHQIMEENGIFHVSSIYDGGHGFKDMQWHQDGGFALSDEQLRKVEELSYRKAAEYPENRFWKFFNEPHVSDFFAHPEMFPQMQKAILASQKGILRANPNARFIGSDPSNMVSSSGVAFVDKQLAAAGRTKLFDVAAIHPYRARPEEPDRDKDTATFLAMLDRHGFKGDVWFTEGIYHQNYVIPQWELNTHQGCSSDHYRAGAASYGMGWGERMAMTYAARSWLVSLKYGERVKMDVDWGFWNNSRLDLDNTPCALAYASNTLGNILGNADFRRDVNLGYEAHCYLFENESQEPVAAIWYANMDSDKGRTDGPRLDVANLSKAMPGLRYADMMGVGHPLEDTLALSPFPVFVTGPKASLESFAEHLGKASILGGKGQLHAWLALKSPTELEATIENTLNHELKGKYRLLQSGTEIATGNVAVPALSSWTLEFDEPIKPNTLNVTDLTLEIIPDGDQTQKFELRGSWMLWPKRSSELSMDGSLKGWESAFHAEVTNKVEFPPHDAKQRALSPDMNPFPWKGADDLSATLYATWDEENLYLAVKVKDDPFQQGESPQMGWKGDGLQLYFDGWANAAAQRRKDYDGDDQSFMIWPKPPEAVVYRDVAPERQLAFLDQGEVKDAKGSTVKTADGDLVYHITLPLRDIQPVKLEALQKFGFCALVNESDGDYRKRSLTLTPEKTEPYRRPDLYPTVMLVP